MKDINSKKILPLEGNKKPKFIIWVVLVVIILVIILIIFLNRLGGCKNEEIDPQCVALIKEDSSYCDKKQDIENVSLCYDAYHLQLAIFKVDSSLCGDIVSDTTKQTCLAVVNDDISFCDKVTTDLEKNVCKNILELQEPEEEYLDGYYVLTSLKSKNIELCEKIKNHNDASLCKAVLSDDKSYCTDFHVCP